MDRLKRVAVILLGYIVSCLFPPLFLLLLWKIPTRTYDPHGPGLLLYALELLIVVGCIPSIGAIVASEIFRIRKIWAHLAAGVAIPFISAGVIFVLDAIFSQPRQSLSPMTFTPRPLRLYEVIIPVAFLLFTGVINGFIYWLIAGRNAGIVQERRKGSVQPVAVTP